MKFSLANLQNIEINLGDIRFTGGSQEWYSGAWQRASGCGPVAASNLLWYLGSTRESLRGLCDGYGEMQSYKKLMVSVFGFMQPALKGINTAELFIGGVQRYLQSRSIRLEAQTLEITQKKKPSFAEICAFVSESLQADTPVAFLNLTNGKLKNLEAWHWVTIIGLDEERGIAVVSDYGQAREIDIKMWLETTFMGGAMVALKDDTTPGA